MKNQFEFSNEMVELSSDEQKELVGGVGILIVIGAVLVAIGETINFFFD
jgi:hypothetical protein